MKSILRLFVIIVVVLAMVVVGAYFYFKGPELVEAEAILLEGSKIRERIKKQRQKFTLKNLKKAPWGLYQVLQGLNTELEKLLGRIKLLEQKKVLFISSNFFEREKALAGAVFGLPSHKKLVQLRAIGRRGRMIWKEKIYFWKNDRAGILAFAREFHRLCKIIEEAEKVLMLFVDDAKAKSLSLFFLREAIQYRHSEIHKEVRSNLDYVLDKSAIEVSNSFAKKAAHFNVNSCVNLYIIKASKDEVMPAIVTKRELRKACHTAVRIIDAELDFWENLHKPLQIALQSAKTFFTRPLGYVGEEVAVFQREMVKLGGLKNVSGIYDPKTYSLIAGMFSENPPDWNNWNNSFEKKLERGEAKILKAFKAGLRKLKREQLFHVLQTLCHELPSETFCEKSKDDE